MPTTRARGLQVYDPVLTNLARSYRPGGFIARRLLPQISVSSLSVQYPVFTKSFWFQDNVDTLIADRAPTKEIDFEFSHESAVCVERGLKVSITDLERQQASAPGNAGIPLERAKVEFLTHRMELAREIRVAALLNTQDAGGGLDNAMDATPGTNWDQATATIETDIKTGVETIYDKTGLVPNVMVVPFKVAYAMAVQEDIRNILKYEAAGRERGFIELGSRVLPSVIHGMQVIVAQGGQKDTAREGGTESISEIWDDHVRLLYVNPSAGWGIPSVAYELVHTPKRVTRWRETDPDLEYIREMERGTEKVVAPEAGYIIKDVLS